MVYIPTIVLMMKHFKNDALTIVHQLGAVQPEGGHTSAELGVILAAYHVVLANTTAIHFHLYA